MRLNCYPHPTEGLWISESNLASALKEGEADVCWYGVDYVTKADGTLGDALRAFLDDILKDTFHRLVWHNGLRIKKAIVRELKWLGISLLWCWMPLREWLEARIGTPGKLWPPNGYLYVSIFMFLMVAGALLEIALCLYERRSLPKRFEKFKIATIRHFSARPRSPVSRTIDASNQVSRINLKFWAVFLIICIVISCVVPVGSDWVIVHPLGGKDYITTGPALIRPLSSWRVVPETHQATIWTPLRLIGERVVILELKVEWRVTKPLQFEPREWHMILDRAVGFYIGNVMENMKNSMAMEVQDEDAQEIIIISELARNLDVVGRVIEEQIGSPEPMKIIEIKVRTISLSEYSLYYQGLRR